MSQKNKPKITKEDLELILKLYSEIRFPAFLPTIPYEWVEEIKRQEKEGEENDGFGEAYS